MIKLDSPPSGCSDLMTPPLPSHRRTIALLAALHSELSTTIARLGLQRTEPKAYYKAQVGQVRIVAAVAGMGACRAVAATNALVDAVSPDQVVLLGFAGGLDPRLRPAALLPISWALNEDGTVVQIGDDTFTPAVPRVVNDEPSRDTQRSLVTVDRLVETVAAKHRAFARYRCSAVDMETYHVAHLLAQRGVPLAVVRSINDTADMSLPTAVIDWVKPNGKTDAVAAARYLMAHPWQASTLLRLGKNARLAAARLADAVQSLIQAQKT